MYKIANNYLMKILIFFVVLISVGLVFRHYYYVDITNSDKLNFITDSGDNQAYHPKIIAFNEPWHGYKYWVAFTPYKFADETKENPCINASNNLIKWEVPNGLTNPINKPSLADKYHYNSDSHLLYNSQKDELELFWRYVDDSLNKVYIYESTSKDGINWSDKKIFLYSDSRSDRDYVSPAIILNDNKYEIWYVDNKKVYYIEKTESNISNPKIININYPSQLYTWHIDVINNNETYEMVMVAYQNANNRKNMNLYYSYSTDNVDWSIAKLIMKPSSINNKWDSMGLYRSSLLYLNNKYYLFYSGHDESYNVGIGLMCGKNIYSLKDCTMLEEK